LEQTYLRYSVKLLFATVTNVNNRQRTMDTAHWSVSNRRSSAPRKRAIDRSSVGHISSLQRSRFLLGVVMQCMQNTIL